MAVRLAALGQSFTAVDDTMKSSGQGYPDVSNDHLLDGEDEHQHQLCQDEGEHDLGVNFRPDLHRHKIAISDPRISEPSPRSDETDPD